MDAFQAFEISNKENIFGGAKSKWWVCGYTIKNNLTYLDYTDGVHFQCDAITVADCNGTYSTGGSN